MFFQIVDLPAIVYMGSDDQKVYCLNATTGILVWSYATGGPVRSSPAVAYGTVYVGSEDGGIYAFGSMNDVAVADLEPSKTVAGRGFSVFINSTVGNQGELTEIFNVTFYANTTMLETKEVILTRDDCATLTLTWNTTGYSYGDYIISAYAWPVSGETNTANNNFTGVAIHVSIPGDVTGNFIVDIFDAIVVAGHFNQTPANPPWNASADINGDNAVDIYDAIILAGHYNQHFP